MKPPLLSLLRQGGPRNDTSYSFRELRELSLTIPFPATSIDDLHKPETLL